jgi:hypothetical protein
MSPLSIIVTLVVAGILLHFLNSVNFIDSKFKKLINIVAIVLAVLFVAHGLGLFNYLQGLNRRP